MFPFFVLIIFYGFSPRAKIVALLCGQPQFVSLCLYFWLCSEVFVSIHDFLFARALLFFLALFSFFVVRTGPNF